MLVDWEVERADTIVGIGCVDEDVVLDVVSSVAYYTEVLPAGITDDVYDGGIVTFINIQDLISGAGVGEGFRERRG